MTQEEAKPKKPLVLPVVNTDAAKLLEVKPRTTESHVIGKPAPTAADLRALVAKARRPK